ncbi:tripartite tricarboxylate transporter permease [Nitratireductor indicus]|uniref:tripartite tricarboxylate transporter permease n=1 Tax=Nitratireductor indicus TaxID=721133 RepID=UPI002874F384|nr:tripartite tricarboxylate transporter permease [Nitratireductor indicus]MDS1137116.1 tripartite tricarboxylate transporter permease [Nitratireductor indicus]
MEAFIQAIGLITTPQTLVAIAISCTFGLFVGAIPGLSATMATALLVPFTFYLDPIPAIATVIACTTMAITAGDIPAVMLRIPGTPSSAAYAEEAYAMTRKGQGSLAMGTLLVSACIGGFIGFIVLALVAPMLAKVALRFSSFEYFWLAALGLSCAALVSGGGMIKSVIALLTGLAAATVGMDPLTATPRFTFGVTELSGGLSFVPAMIGLFAVGELMRGDADVRAASGGLVGGVFKGVGSTLSKYRYSLFRGAGFGTLIGALPGAGGDLGAWIAYAFSKRFSRTPERYGKGHPEGLVEAGACNNAALCSAWIPAMVFGIPGDAVTAIAVGVLFMKGLNPGPQLMTENVQNFYAVMLIFVIANALIIPLGWLAIRTARRLFSVPRHYLAGVILIFSIVGSYAAVNSLFGIVVMAGFGVLAWWFGKAGIPIAPVILGMVMGPLVEQNFLTSMIISRGNFLGFFERPISATLGVMFIAIWLVPLAIKLTRRLRAP